MTGGRPRIADNREVAAERAALRRAFVELRQHLRLRQADVAKALGVSRQAVSQWETGERFLTAPALRWMDEAMGAWEALMAAEEE